MKNSLENFSSKEQTKEEDKQRRQMEYVRMKKCNVKVDKKFLEQWLQKRQIQLEK